MDNNGCFNVIKFKEIIGDKIISISGLEKGSEELIIETYQGNFKMFIEPRTYDDASVSIFAFDWDNYFLNKNIIDAEIVSVPGGTDSKTWTFYKIEVESDSSNGLTFNHGLFVIWIGESSNGLYGEDVECIFTKKQINQTKETEK